MHLAKARSAALALVTALLFSYSSSVAVTIDDLSDQFPPNPDLPVSGRPVIFVGYKCDGSACPPGVMVTHTGSDAAYQTGLAGVLGGEREAVIYEVTGTADAGIWGPGNVISFNHNAGASAILDLFYGVSAELNADLTAGMATALIVEVLSGDMYAGPRPVHCTITVTSNLGTGSETTASQTLDLIDETEYEFPFTGFAGIDFTDVDRISYRFDASDYTSVDFSIGPLRTDEEMVGVEDTTWGAIKSQYR